MPFHFCPQCGTKLQPDFRFCPSCGEKLPCSADEPGVGSSAAPLKDEATTAVINTSPAAKVPTKDGKSPISPRPALRNTRNTLQLQKNVKFNIQGASPSSSPDTTEAMSVGSQTSPTSPISHTVRANLEIKPTSEASSPSAVKSPRPVRGKAKLSSPTKKEAEEGKIPCDKATEALKVERPVSSKSPLKGGGSKAKKAKHASLLEPLQEGEELTDKTGKKWKLVKLIGQSPTDLLYEVAQPRSKEADHVLKLGAKDGKIFTEQNFLQRAAKSASVEKWIKQNKMDFLGIPNCVGFGLHADSYRFLVFPNMGSSLQSVMEEGNGLLSEEAVLQLACRLLDVLEFIHSNEYVHADINAENVYIKAGQRSQVYLVGYCHAVRYCPGGQHVEYRENSRMPHEGAIELISLDAHNGAAPSRRSDLQSLGYCMLMWHTGTLPWLDLAQPEQVATQKRRYVDDVKALLSFCFGKRKVPGAFQSFLTAVMALQYDEEPNYSELKAELSAALQQLGGSVDQPLNISM
ncbi:inactive serine/threonine-protein kinase VRK3 isoform X1 [Fundulus heteroclitus]|uniref:inactive serine/threonine-protein kinase VRK3 isoform X1 n=1 Tax=Fundulus heteroclitus TaxID=8078 RepID=UPI00165C3DB6|nr:inactive serine/threonine-protein kinase VRK3 isoform X1 [Fundulus heteroclitus]